MEQKRKIMTAKGKKAYEDELQELKVVRRKEIAEKIKEAREQGDLSENAEYDAAKDEQREIERRIDEIEEILKIAEVVSEEEIESGRVHIGCTVTVQDTEDGFEEIFTIVGSSEGTESLSNRISNESPIGIALLGRAVDDIVTVEAPAGEFSYRIIKVERSEN